MTLEDIAKLCGAASPGPWSVEHEPAPDTYVVSTIIDSERNCLMEFSLSKPDADFAAASRTLLPKLLRVAEAAKAARGLSPDCCCDIEYVCMTCKENKEALDKALADLDAEG